MTKVLALNGSPRGVKGNTQVLLDAFLRGLVKGKKDLEIKTLFINELEINHCKGCFTCWNIAPGECIWKDDMSIILQDYVEADIIIYATPLYYYGITSSLKKLIERLLPLYKPNMVKKDGHYTHPTRHKEKPQKNVLISTCGFPERHHFEPLLQQFNAMGNMLNETILCTEGELLTIGELSDVCSRYVGATEKAGFEFISHGCISLEIHEELKKEFTDVENFVNMANMYWNVPGEKPPSYEETHGSTVDMSLKSSSLLTNSKVYKEEVFEYIEGMSKVFNPSAAKDIKSKLQIEFTDIGEACYLHIENDVCTFYKGRTENPTTTISTPAEVWLKIDKGDLQGTKALMDGLYSVQGDFTIMMKMNEIFPSAGVSKPKELADKGFLKFVSPMVWLSLVSFIPWYVFWLTSNKNTAASAYVPLFLSILVFFYRKAYIEVTSFDMGNIAFFATIFCWQLFDKTSYISYAGIIGSIGLAVIWCSSLMTDTPTTAWYSKWNYSEDIATSSVFIKINQILTSFWVIIYLLQALARIVIPNSMVLAKNVFVYGILIIAGLFTSWFSNWYPVYVMTQKTR